MNIKSIKLGVIGGVCFFGLATALFAQGHANNDQSTVRHGGNQNNSGTIQRHVSHAKPAHHNQHHRNDFSFSMNGQAFRANFATPPQYVSFNQTPRHAHRQFGPQWINSFVGAQVPREAVMGGAQAGNVFFVCRAHYADGLHPGKLTNGQCHISFGGKEFWLTAFQVLVSHRPLNWSAGNYGYIPPNAFFGGGENDGRPLFICQAAYHGGMHPGKIVGQMCNIAFNGREIGIPYYNVLVV